MSMEERFQFIALEEAVEFLDALDNKTRKKVMFNIWKSKSVNDPELLKHLHDGIWEFRTYFNKQYIRLFAFWDKSDETDTLVVATHGIYKKSAKILRADIERAGRLRLEYFKSK